jgi:SSS family solute:Na+ symporter
LQKAFHFDTDNPRDFAWLMIITVSITTVVWLATTFLTRPEPQEVLIDFYARCRPSAAGWGPIARLRPDIKPTRDGLANLLDWIAGCALIYGVLFGTGKLLLHESGVGLALLAIGLLGGAVIYWDLSRRGWSAVVD